LVLSFQKQI